VVIDVQFSGQVNAAAASNIRAYLLFRPPAGKKHTIRPVKLSTASYNSAAATVMLIPKGSSLSRNPSLFLSISGTVVVDTLGRPIDGNDDGRPGGDYAVILSKAGASVLHPFPPGMT
jgi:hypothetical protein